MASIRANFLTFILPVVAISFILLATVLTMVSVERLEQQSVEKINNSNDYLQKNINNWLSFQKNMVSSISDLAIKSNSPSAAISLNSQTLESIKREFDYRNIALVDTEGKARLSANIKRVGADYSKLNYIATARENKGNVITSNVRFSRVDGTPLISFAKTLPSNETVFTSVPLQNLYQDYVQTNRDQKFNYAFILTENCQLLAHPLLGQENAPKVSYNKLCGDDQVTSFEENGEYYIASVTQNPLTKWYVVTSVNQKSIDEVVQNVVETGIVIGLIVLMVVVFTVVVLTGSLSKRMSKIVKVIDLASQGDLAKLDEQKDQLLSLTKKRDEVGKMASATQLLVHSQEQKIAFAKAIADGDLNHNLDVHVNDMLGNALKVMEERLRGLIEQLILVANEIDNASDALAKQSTGLQSGVVEQREAVTGIANLITALKEHIHEQSVLVDTINNKAEVASSEASNSKEQMQEMINSLEEINESGQNISGIMVNITDVSEQTNLIALNAAIEAARAGEHGRGFAVVADEVRGLAARSSDAASQTSRLVETSLAAIASGKNATAGTESAFLGIVTHITSLSESLETIKQFSTEQSKTMQSVSDGLDVVENITEVNNQSSDNVFEQCSSLTSLTQRLKIEIQKFKL